MEHIIQFGVNIDEEEIKKTVQKHYNEYCEKLIKSYIQKAILDIDLDSDIGNYIGWRNKAEIKETLRNKVDVQVNVLLAQNKDVIIEKASDKLATRIRMSKKGKEIFDKLEQEIERWMGLKRVI